MRLSKHQKTAKISADFLITMGLLGFIILGFFSLIFGISQESQPLPSTMTESEARQIAESVCIKGGEAIAPGYYNEMTKTWWFDANLNMTKPGCNPACVVDETTKTAEINWRCTGLPPLPNTPGKAINSFEECVAAGNPVMESYPRQCRANGQTFIEVIETAETACTREQRQTQACTKEYLPVCAQVRVECIKAPCEPIPQTFGNVCSACQNERVLSYQQGECQ